MELGIVLSLLFFLCVGWPLCLDAQDTAMQGNNPSKPILNRPFRLCLMALLVTGMVANMALLLTTSAEALGWYLNNS